MRVGLVQLNSSDDPEANLAQTLDLIRDAAASGSTLIVTPECTNIVSASRTRQREVLRPEDQDLTLVALCELARELSVHILIGSLLLKSDRTPDRFVNRSFFVDPTGRVVAKYDKIHMFDADPASGERYRESAAFDAGSTAVLGTMNDAVLGLTICYDLRFPGLYRTLAQAGAQILTVPSAFTVPTGEAHWSVLLRARAIENGAFVLAPAQWGVHAATRGAARRTYGHSLAVGPWGEVLAEAEDGTGASIVDLDLDAVSRARAAIPSLRHDRPISAPKV